MERHRIDGIRQAENANCLILRSLDNLLQKQYMSHAMSYAILFSYEEMFGNKKSYDRQATLRTIMNTKMIK